VVVDLALLVFKFVDEYFDSGNEIPGSDLGAEAKSTSQELREEERRDTLSGAQSALVVGTRPYRDMGSSGSARIKIAVLNTFVLSVSVRFLRCSTSAIIWSCSFDLKAILLTFEQGARRSRAELSKRHIAGTRCVKDTVERGASVYTDAFQSYTGLDWRYDHRTVDHAERYVDGQVHTS